MSLYTKVLTSIAEIPKTGLLEQRVSKQAKRESMFCSILILCLSCSQKSCIVDTQISNIWKRPYPQHLKEDFFCQID